MIPSQSGKTTLENLRQMPRFENFNAAAMNDSAPCLYKIDISGFQFDFLWSPQRGAKRIFVLFSGDAMRTKNNPPVFQRWSWSSSFPGHCVYFSDPSLFLNDKLGLAWYSGTKEFDPLVEIIKIVSDIGQRFEINANNVCSYGSSGGGFAALRMAAMMENSTAISVNPQTVITEYRRKIVERYIGICFDEEDPAVALKKYCDRLSIMGHVDALSDRRIVYIQNTLDEHHYESHYLPFCRKMGCGEAANELTGNFRRILFSHEGGHTKAETPEVFSKAIKIVEGWT